MSTAPRTAPYVRESQLTSYVKAMSSTNKDRIMEFAAGWCRWLDRYLGRRFDEYITTLSFRPVTQSYGGAIDTDGFLLLDMDLREIITLTDASGVVQSNLETYGDPLIRKVRPLNFGTWGSGGYITLQGKFGFGGYWDDLATTTTTALASTSATSFTVGADVVEKGMILKLEDEYLEVTAYDSTTNTVTVKRGQKGSTAVIHNSGLTPQVFVYDEMIVHAIKRLTAWATEQATTPMAGQVVIGDFTYPVSVDGLPKDVLLELKLGGYAYVPRIKSA